MSSDRSAKPSWLALIPFGVFAAFYVGLSLYAGNQGFEMPWYKVPMPIAFLVASAVALVFGRRNFSEKVDIYAKGMGETNIMIMCLIFILAGAFATIAKGSGAVDAAVALAQNVIPAKMMVAGVFLVSCVISTAIGTSCGTIAAVAPIALSFAGPLELPPVLLLGSVVAGAMFGDNLSMISDTTIAATRTQGVRMKDKFRANILLAAPAALVACGLYGIAGSAAGSIEAPAVGWHEAVLVAPYLLILVLALVGFNVMALAVMTLHITELPKVFEAIFVQAFDTRSAFGGFLGAAIMNGIKRGLYSNEAGVGSAPNAAASAGVSHPVKQGLGQLLSVFIDTILICSATAFILLCSGVDSAGYVAGTDNARFIQDCMKASFGPGGGVLLTVALVIFAYTTLVGNYFYAEQSVRYFYPKAHDDRKFMLVYRIVAIAVILVGSQFEAALAWNISDVIMGLMALINIPVCVILGKKAYVALWDYMVQRNAGHNPTFHPQKLYGTDEGMECWPEKGL